jgi:hypothetical protein
MGDRFRRRFCDGAVRNQIRVIRYHGVFPYIEHWYEIPAKISLTMLLWRLSTKCRQKRRSPVYRGSSVVRRVVLWRMTFHWFLFIVLGRLWVIEVSFLPIALASMTLPYFVMSS